MKNKSFIGKFKSENEVLDKIDALRVQGFSEADMYVITNDTQSLSMVRGRTGVDLKSSEGTWMDRFKAFLSGDERVKAAFTNMGFSKEESNHYFNEVKRGGILLYVDRDYDHEAIVASSEEQVDVGSGLVVDPVDSPIHAHRDIDAEVGPDKTVTK